jgi:hypothetical protein
MATEPRWLDETEMAAWHSLVVAGMHMFAALDRDLRDAFDVTLLGHGILLMLRNNSEGLTMGHRASQFGTEASVITKAGERLCDRMGPVHVKSVRANFLDHVPRKDLPAVGDAFDLLYAAQHRDTRCEEASEAQVGSFKEMMGVLPALGDLSNGVVQRSVGAVTRPGLFRATGIHR